MDILVNIIIFLFALSVIWFFAGLLLDTIGRLSSRLCASGFGVAFFILGFLTSIGEISVAVNSGINGVPGVSAGNLAGASFVILLLIVPFLAVAGNGMSIRGLVSKQALAFTLLVIMCPILLLADGRVTMLEGAFAILAYCALAYSIWNRPEGRESNVCIPETSGNRLELWLDGAKLVVGALAVFVASHFLVQETVTIAMHFTIPASLIGLLVLSVGTNIPEIVIAVRAVLRKQKDVAFGDYLGSAAANVPIFGALALFTGGFAVESSEFVATSILSLAGFVLFYFFTRSHSTLSRREGAVLLMFYAAFVLIQIINVVRFTVG